MSAKKKSARATTQETTMTTVSNNPTISVCAQIVTGSPNRFFVKAEVTLPSGWYSTNVELYQQTGSTPMQWVSSMMFTTAEGVDLGSGIFGTKETWEAEIWGGSSSVKFIAEAVANLFQNKVVTGLANPTSSPC